MTLADYIAAGSGFGFEHPETVTRLRARDITDRYSTKPIAADWSNPHSITIPNAHISTSGSTPADGTQRRQVTENAQLVVADPAVDVRLGDRIQRGTDLWEVVGFPQTDSSPFTGWQPTLVADLEEVHG